MQFDGKTAIVTGGAATLAGHALSTWPAKVLALPSTT